MDFTIETTQVELSLFVIALIVAGLVAVGVALWSWLRRQGAR